MATQTILKDEKFWATVLGAAACVALAWMLINDPGDWPSILVNFAQIGAVLIVFVLTHALKEKGRSHLELAKEQLAELQKKYPAFLKGPRYNRENYDPEKGKGQQYLFITNPDPKSTQRVKFIPVDPLSEGVLSICVSKGTLVWGLGYSSEAATIDEIKRIQNAVSGELISHIQTNYAGQHEILQPAKEDLAVLVDFDEEKMSKKKYAKAVYDCSEVAVKVLLRFKK